MYNVLMVIANHDFQDLEFSNPYQLFLDKEYTVDICSGKGGECFGVFTTYIEDSLSFDEVNPDNYDVIVFVGGGGAYSEYHDNEAYQALAKQSLSSPNGETRILGAICIAPSLLASIGLFEGKEVTGRDDGKGTEIAILEESWAKFIGQEVVRDGNIITANGPQASVAFGWKIIEALEE